MVGYYAYYIIRARLQEKRDLPKLDVSRSFYRKYFIFPVKLRCLLLSGGAGFTSALLMLGIVHTLSAPSPTNLVTMSKILDSNFSVTPTDYYKEEFRAFTISAPSTTAQITVLDKVVTTQIPVLAFTISAHNLKKLEHAVKDQPQLLSKLQ